MDELVARINIQLKNDLTNKNVLENQELNLEHRITLVIPNIIDNKNLFLEIMLVTFMETLANTVYLSQINLFFKDKNLEDIWKKKIKEVLSF